MNVKFAGRFSGKKLLRAQHGSSKPIIWQMCPSSTKVTEFQELKKIINNSLKKFSNKEVAKIRPVSHYEWLLELYHGPTLAFKDYALQIVGNLLDYNHRRAVVWYSRYGGRSTRIYGYKSDFKRVFSRLFFCKKIDQKSIVSV